MPNTIKILYIYSLISALLISCGPKPTEEDEAAVGEPTSTPGEESPVTPILLPADPGNSNSADATPPPAAPSNPQPPVASVFVASNILRAISYYTKEGVYLGYIDLSNYLATGSITSLTFFSKDILIATADPGAAGEKLIRIDLSGNGVSSINMNWYQDASNINATVVPRVVKWSNSKLLAVKQSTMIEGISYNMGANLVARLGAPFINTGLTGTATCNNTLLQYATPVSFNGVTKLMTLSSGVNARLNLIAGIDSAPTCNASVNYVAGSITAGHIPTGSVQMADGFVYVRYQFTSAPAIVRYAYDGNTFTSPTVVYNDSGFLNATTSDRELMALDSSHVLFSNWSQDSVLKLNLSTSETSIFARNIFTTDVTSIALRPVQ
jgi:hypothetical protein